MADVVSSQQTSAHITVSTTDLLLMLIYSKLHSIEWGATRTKDPKLASFAGSITGTSTAQEICRWVMPADVWCETGVLECEVTGDFANETAGTLNLEIYLQVADAPPTTDDTAAAAYGVLQSFSNVTGFVSTTIPVAVGVGTFMYELRLCANGATSGTAWSQRGHQSMARTSFPLSSPPQDVEQIIMAYTTINPTTDKWFRLVFYTSAAVGAGQQFVVKSAHVRLMDGR